MYTRAVENQEKLLQEDGDEVRFHNWAVTLMCEPPKYQEQQGVRQGGWGLYEEQ